MSVNKLKIKKEKRRKELKTDRYYRKDCIKLEEKFKVHIRDSWDLNFIEKLAGTRLQDPVKY